MDPLSLILGIVVVTSIAGVIRSYFAFKSRSEHMQEIDRLRVRVEALERRNT